MTIRRHRGRHARGYLPHVDHPRLIQSVTIRLHDAVPADVVAAWKRELDLGPGAPAGDPRSVELRQRIATYEDAGHGGCWLARADVGRLVEGALLCFDGDRYALRAWCVMPNHVHVVLATAGGRPLGDVVHSWKSFTAKAANERLGREGAFWMPDYHDRFIRDDTHLRAALAYVENNPVAAGLVETPEAWTFSSARRTAAGPAAVPGPRDRRP